MGNEEGEEDDAKSKDGELHFCMGNENRKSLKKLVSMNLLKEGRRGEREGGMEHGGARGKSPLNNYYEGS